MIEKKTVIDRIEVEASGHVQVRLALLILDNGVEISRRWHRTSIEPGGDIDAMIAAVNADITTRDTLQASPIDPAKIPLVKAICQVAQTPSVVLQYKADIAAASKRMTNGPKG